MEGSANTLERLVWLSLILNFCEYHAKYPSYILHDAKPFYKRPKAYAWQMLQNGGIVSQLLVITVKSWQLFKTSYPNLPMQGPQIDGPMHVWRDDGILFGTVYYEIWYDSMEQWKSWQKLSSKTCDRRRAASPCVISLIDLERKRFGFRWSHMPDQGSVAGSSKH